MRWKRTLLLVALVTLAGCAGVFGDEGATATPEPTQTPAPTITQSPTATPTPTATQREPRIDPDIRQRYERLNERVDAETVSLLESRIINETTVGYVIAQNTNESVDKMVSGSAQPVPQAVALEMAQMDNPPKRAVLSVRSYYDAIIWRSTLSVETAERFANYSLLVPEFANALSDRASGSATRNPEQKDTILLTWANGDRARQNYARALADEVRDSGRFSDLVNVTDYGLFNQSVYLEDSDIKVEENSSIYIEVQHPRDGGQKYKWEEREEHTRYISTSIVQISWAVQAYNRNYGTPPENVRVDYIDMSGERYMKVEIPKEFAIAFASENLSKAGYDIALAEGFEEYNGGRD